MSGPDDLINRGEVKRRFDVFAALMLEAGYHDFGARMAQSADGILQSIPPALPEVQAIVAEAVKAERESCIAECQHIASALENESNPVGMRAAEHCAAAIRKRGEG